MKNLSVLVCLVAINLLFCSYLKAQQLSTKKAGLTTHAGIFTKKQVELGSALFITHCAACHGRDLRGTEGGNALIGDRFIAKWKDKSVGQLFDLTKSTMPKTNPHSLDNVAYSSLLAFILNSNGFPDGDVALSSKKEALAVMLIGNPPPSSRVSMQFKPATYNTKPTTIEADWRQHRGDYASSNYSPLDQINKENAKNLKIAWRWKTDNFGASPEFYFKSTPLMVNGVLYTTAGLSRTVAAIDAENGETLWTFRFDEKERKTYVPRQNSGRGVAYWASPEKGKDRIIYITPSFQLVALDAKTGHLVPDFGDNGVVDLKKGLDQPIDPLTATIGSTSPPLLSMMSSSWEPLFPWGWPLFLKSRFGETSWAMM
ncbi:PQQ-binding-like beta-propeller repeat protein [Spirosoma sp. HMF3257]|uniref:Cytochrome c domain-containing protein n=1 Tax=Spirosoma telluris TaxID=2183553 RepID=A0A327NN44_9BACT|nr:PQQ-binding-like beta-propeller repeat protein [Spirosoma telluris]RAI76861.1 hypothetical protein HMF3257_26680 [Spirosoma telluris]